MTCKGICKSIHVELGTKPLDDLPDVRRCAICGANIPKKNWVIGKSGRVRCPCCNYQLRIHSRGTKSRKRRQEEFQLKAK